MRLRNMKYILALIWFSVGALFVAAKMLNFLAVFGWALAVYALLLNYEKEKHYSECRKAIANPNSNKS